MLKFRLVVGLAVWSALVAACSPSTFSARPTSTTRSSTPSRTPSTLGRSEPPSSTTKGTKASGSTRTSSGGAPLPAAASRIPDRLKVELDDWPIPAGGSVIDTSLEESGVARRLIAFQRDGRPCLELVWAKQLSDTEYVSGDGSVCRRSSFVGAGAGPDNGKSPHVGPLFRFGFTPDGTATVKVECPGVDITGAPMEGRHPLIWMVVQRASTRSACKLYALAKDGSFLASYSSMGVPD